MTSAVRLPREMADAIVRSETGDFASLLDALGQLEIRSKGLGWLALWRVAQDRSYEYLRVLTFAVARDTRDSDVDYSVGREAVRLWALNRETDDLSTCVNVLSGLEYSLDLPDGLPGLLSSSIVPFVMRCLVHGEALVRHSAIDFLSAACAHDQLRMFVHKGAAARLDDTIAEHLSFDDADEQAAASELLSGLRSELLPDTAAVAPRMLRRLLLDLEDLASSALVELDGVDGLVSFVQERLLLDSAGDEARKRQASLQTIRMMSEAPSAKLLDSLLRLASTIVRLRADNDNDNDNDNEEEEGAYSSVQVLAAPAASFPIHVCFQRDYANMVFGVLSDVFDMLNGGPISIAMEQFEPSLAQAVLSVVKQAASNGGIVDIILTEPTAREWQRKLRVDLSEVSASSLEFLSSLARSKRPRGGVVVDRLMVPQANTVTAVFQAVDAMLAKGKIAIEDIDGISSRRQVDYYRQGARVLGLFDEENELTQRARSLVGLSIPDRLRLAAVYFEDSEIGRAWQAWAAVDHIVEIDPESSVKFLAECVVGLSGSTLPRRASTLRKWLTELSPYHYTRRQMSLNLST